MSKYIVTLDAGTTSERAILFDKQGQIKQITQQAFEQIFPRPGWVEHEPEIIWKTQLGVLKELIKQGNLTQSDIAAIGITNQRETTIVWERKTGKPIYNAIVWQDRRTADTCEKLKAAGHSQKIKEKTGLLIDAYFSATKIRWILDHLKDGQKRAERGELCFGTVDTWLLWKLTKGKHHTTDISNASRTLLFNIREFKWDDELLELFDIPFSMLPEVFSNSHVYGQTDKSILDMEIPIAGMGGDQQCALFGQMCVDPGMLKNTYGTGCFAVLNTGEKIIESKHQLLSTIAWKLGDKTTYAIEGSIFMGGALVQWLRDNLGLIKDAPAIEALASQVSDNGGVYFVPGFVGLGAPHWDQYSTGMLIGLSRGTTQAHIARAALEALALQSRDVFETMKLDAGIELNELRVDGGAATNNLLMQIQSDLTGLKVTRPVTTETTALGAAYFAGLAVGFWNDLDELKKQWQANHTFYPQASSEETKKTMEDWHRAIARARGWLKK